MLRLHSTSSFNPVALALLIVGVSCAQAEGFTSDRGATAGSGGESGGTTQNGGTSGSSSTISGGASGATANASGGTTATGGATSSGGSAAKGGATSKGGTASTGGTTSTGGSPGTPGATLLSDDFEDKEAANWYPADTNGTRAVALQGDSYAYVMTTTDKALSVGGSVDWVNQRVEAKVQFVEAANSPTIYLMARWAEAKSYLVIEFRPGTAAKPQGDMKLRQTDAGSTSDLCRFKPTSVLPGTWYTIGLSVSAGQNSTATLLFDGQPVTIDPPCVLTKAGPSNGGVAVGVQNGTAAFDDVLVTVPD